MAPLVIETLTETEDELSVRELFGPRYLRSLSMALLLLGLAYVCEHFANLYELAYSLRPTSAYVGDLVLDNLPIVNLNLVIIEGALISIIASVAFVFSRPRYIIFTLKALALFIILRAFFVSLTHVGIYPGAIDPGFGFFSNVYSYLNFQTGFFFSGHTGLPFLMALIFWQELRVRATFLVLSCTFGIAVLLAHVHYSIDVFAAPFMAYSIFMIAKHLFKKDYELIEPV